MVYDRAEGLLCLYFLKKEGLIFFFSELVKVGKAF